MKLVTDKHGKDDIDLTYVDLLSMLESDVEADALMPGQVKRRAKRLVEKLQELLYPYSA